jgi:hypothetical protein
MKMFRRNFLQYAGLEYSKNEMFRRKILHYRTWHKPYFYHHFSELSWKKISESSVKTFGMIFCHLKSEKIKTRRMKILIFEMLILFYVQ